MLCIFILYQYVKSDNIDLGLLLSKQVTYVTLPPKMSWIATWSLLGYSQFPKGGAIYRFWLFNEISFSNLFYIRKIHFLHTKKEYTCYH